MQTMLIKCSLSKRSNELLKLKFYFVNRVKLITFLHPSISGYYGSRAFCCTWVIQMGCKMHYTIILLRYNFDTPCLVLLNKVFGLM